MNIRPSLIINGVSSQSITGLLITELAPISKPPVRVLTEVIDGKDGDNSTKLGYGAYDKPVKIALAGNYDVDEVIKYFDSEGVVTFSNEPDKYYNFAIYEQIDLERLLRFKTAEVLFHVQPFKFSTLESELVFTISSNPATVKVFNSGNKNSKPNLTFTGSGNVTVKLNNYNILALALGDTSQTIIIDLEKMNAYGLNGTLLNRLVTGDYDKIEFKQGNNNLTVTGSITSVKVNKYSRWI